MMTDTEKIRAIMIYFQHWGRADARARHIADGVRKTITLLEKIDADDDDTLAIKLNRLFACLDYENVWVELTEVLLQDCGGCVFLLDDEYDEDEMLFDRKFLLEENLGLFNPDTADMIYDEEFSYEHALSVDAIVALT